MVCAAATGRIPFGRLDERAVRRGRADADAVRDSSCRSGTQGIGGPGAAAQALCNVLHGTRPANENMWHCPQGVPAFLRAYYHYKSADWSWEQTISASAAWSAPELAKMPTYYIMDAGMGMAETVAAEMPSAAEVAACRWLTEAELAVYGAEYSRTRFPGRFAVVSLPH